MYEELRYRLEIVKVKLEIIKAKEDLQTLADQTGHEEMLKSPTDDIISIIEGIIDELETTAGNENKNKIMGIIAIVVSVLVVAYEIISKTM